MCVGEWGWQDWLLVFLIPIVVIMVLVLGYVFFLYVQAKKEKKQNERDLKKWLNKKTTR